MIIIFKRYAPRSHDPPSTQPDVHTRVFLSRLTRRRFGFHRRSTNTIYMHTTWRAQSCSPTTERRCPWPVSSLCTPPLRQHHHHYRHAISTTTTAAAPLAPPPPPPPRRQQTPLRPVTAISNASPTTPLPSSRHGYHHGRTWTCPHASVSRGFRRVIGCGRPRSNCSERCALVVHVKHNILFEHHYASIITRISNGDAAARSLTI